MVCKQFYKSTLHTCLISLKPTVAVLILSTWYFTLKRNDQFIWETTVEFSFPRTEVLAPSYLSGADPRMVQIGTGPPLYSSVSCL